jgi:hypothetical protein
VQNITKPTLQQKLLQSTKAARQALASAYDAECAEVKKLNIPLQQMERPYVGCYNNSAILEFAQ